MKPIIEKEKLPKFLIVNEVPEAQSYNKHLLKPWKKGELVRVAPFDQQVSNVEYDHVFNYYKPEKDNNSFRKRFVKVIRKDDNGNWTLVYTAGWENFDLLTNNKKKK